MATCCNELQHAIVAVGDVVRSGADSDACEYRVLDTLGSGTFASVFSCARIDTHGGDGQSPDSGTRRVGSVRLRFPTLKYTQLVYGEHTVEAGPHFLHPR